MKRVLKALGLILLVVVLSAAGFYAWASSQVSRSLARTFDVEGHDLPVPWPLTEAELAELRAAKAAEAASGAPSSDTRKGVPALPAPPEGGAPPDLLAGLDLNAIALERSTARGKHLIEARVGCSDCHGPDYGGNVVMDVPPVGRMVCPNLTAGQGSVTKDFQVKDWERIIRHGVKHDGHPATMPSLDFQFLSDQEVSDVIAYLKSQPAVDRTPPEGYLGPVMKVMAALGQIPISADVIDHSAPHRREPPPAEPNVAFGEHIVQACKGCHGPNLTGGPVPGGDPSWPPAANLTPDTTGLNGWTGADFRKAMREGKRPDGTDLNPAMPWKALSHMTDVELDAAWAFLQTLPAKPGGHH